MQIIERCVPTIWPILVPFTCNQHDVIVFCLHNGVVTASARPSITLTCPASSIPARISLIMARGSRCAGYRRSPRRYPRILRQWPHEALTRTIPATARRTTIFRRGGARRLQRFSSASGVVARNPPPPSVYGAVNTSIRPQTGCCALLRRFSAKSGNSWPAPATS